jgi:hypothetical protein
MYMILVLKPLLHYSLKAHLIIKIENLWLEEKSVQGSSSFLHKVEGPKDQENVNAWNINIEPYTHLKQTMKVPNAISYLLKPKKWKKWRKCFWQKMMKKKKGQTLNE